MRGSRGQKGVKGTTDGCCGSSAQMDNRYEIKKHNIEEAILPKYCRHDSNRLHLFSTVK